MTHAALSAAIVLVLLTGCSAGAMRAMSDAGIDIEDARGALHDLDTVSRQLAVDLADDARELRAVAPEVDDIELRARVANVARRTEGHVSTVADLRQDAQDALIALASATKHTDDARSMILPQAAMESAVDGATGGALYWLLGGGGIAAGAGIAMRKRMTRTRRTDAPVVTATPTPDPPKPQSEEQT